MALIKRGEVYHVRTQVAGVLIAKSTKTKNKRIAEQLEAKWISEIHSEVVVAKRMPITVEKAIEEFLLSRRGTAGHVNAENKLQMFSALAKLKLHEVKAADVQSIAFQLLNDEGYAISTVNTAIIYWNAVQNFCTKSNYTAGPKIKRFKGQTGRVRFLSDDEVMLLLAKLNPQNDDYREKRRAQDNLDFTVALLHTGARDREIADLKLNQIDIANNTITIHRSKGGTDTTLKMSNALSEMIKRRIAEADKPLDGLLLHGRAGNGCLFPERAKARYNNEYLGKACAKIGLKDVNLHTLRHTFACKMLRAGISIVEVQHLLGHRNLGSTMCYAHMIPNLTADRAAQVLNA
ncbi:tyrosine-type recombinase/integrase [Sapientia aquatica]|uniref:Site-specific integrase n=1 Tax=Sapientia aquatica TaxID=1549640 RepID=A0A4R5VYR8_9BURK|nr:site-specific integrase [Sapientia aquatica]TDK63697.1 site-specific integrase [Sapientia aquatica]